LCCSASRISDESTGTFSDRDKYVMHSVKSVVRGHLSSDRWRVLSREARVEPLSWPNVNDTIRSISIDRAVERLDQCGCIRGAALIEQIVVHDVDRPTRQLLPRVLERVATERGGMSARAQCVLRLRRGPGF
jgi:hypothetical protein